jgi:metallophosphoesterase (TIGR00282 family)
VLNNRNVVRPYNIKETNEYSKIGVGTLIFEYKNKIFRLTNLLGNSIVNKSEIQTNPFITFNEILKNDKSDIHMVDFHCETTSEKNAFLLTFASKVCAIVCTHTHVQTADERIYKNTAYISDVGMTGGINGVIGAKPETILDMFNERSKKFKLDPQEGKYQFNAVLIEINEKDNLPIKIERINIVEK